MLRKFKNSNGWQKLWVVFTNFCLFFYKTHQVSRCGRRVCAGTRGEPVGAWLCSGRSSLLSEGVNQWKRGWFVAKPGSVRPWALLAEFNQHFQTHEWG